MIFLQTFVWLKIFVSDMVRVIRDKARKGEFFTLLMIALMFSALFGILSGLVIRWAV